MLDPLQVQNRRTYNMSTACRAGPLLSSSHQPAKLRCLLRLGGQPEEDELPRKRTVEAGPVGRATLRAVHAGHAAERHDHQRGAPRAVHCHADELHRQRRAEQKASLPVIQSHQRKATSTLHLYSW